MKAHMLEVYMTMMRNHFFPKNQVFFIVAQMVYAEVVLGVQVNWKTVPSNQASNVPLYQPSRSAGANPLTLPKIRPPLTIVIPILTRRPQFLPNLPMSLPLSNQYQQYQLFLKQ